MEHVTFEFDRVPRAVRDDMARCILERVVAYFEDPAVEADFQKWLKEYKKRKSAQGAEEGSGSFDD